MNSGLFDNPILLKLTWLLLMLLPRVRLVWLSLSSSTTFGVKRMGDEDEGGEEENFICPHTQRK